MPVFTQEPWMGLGSAGANVASSPDLEAKEFKVRRPAMALNLLLMAT